MVTLVNRAKVGTTTTGTGTITLGPAKVGYQTFADAGVVDTNVVRYVIEEGPDWEIGTGTYTASGTTLSRTVTESSNSDSALSLTGSAVVFVGAVVEDLVVLAPLASPALTGTPTTPTATFGTDTTQVSSTAFVLANIAPLAPLASPALTGTPTTPTATFGTNTTQVSSTAFVLANSAPLASPTFTGTPAAPTATFGTDTTQIATTAFVSTATTSTVEALTPASTVDISLASADYFTLALNQNTTLTMSDVGAGVDTFNLAVTGHTISGGGFALSAASYDYLSVTVSTQAASGQGMFFKPDGTRLYVADDSANKVFQYDLTTPWDITTRLYRGIEFNSGAQETGPSGLFFKPDGTKMYVIGTFTDSVYQYSLSTAWDLSTASYDSVSINLNSVGSDPRDIFFKPDGTKMYFLDGWINRVQQYTLSSAWNLATASYDSVFISVNSQDSSPEGLTFNSDGTRMFMTGSASERAHQYTLSSAWNLATASYDSVSFVVTDASWPPNAVSFKPDGSKMFIMTAEAIYQYSTSNLVTATTTYPSSFNFPNGEIPVAAVGGDLNILEAQTTDGGTSWNVHQLGADFS